MSQPLFAPFCSNDVSNRLLVANSADGKNWSGGVDTKQKTQMKPTMVYFNSYYYLYFVAANSTNTLLYITSTDGINWSTQHGLGNGESSKAGPSSVFFEKRIWLAFLSNDSGNSIRIGSMLLDSQTWAITAVLSTNQDPRLPQPPAPAITVHGDKLWLTYVQNDQAYVLSSSDGKTWSTPVAVGSSTRQTASIVSYLDKLFVAVHNMANGFSLLSSADGVTWSAPSPVFEALTPPAFAIFSQRLWMSFVHISAVANRNMLITWSPEGVNWSVTAPLNQQSPHAPGLYSRIRATGNIGPMYQIVTVVYAPPGTEGGNSGSMITYGAGSTLGTVTSNTKSFKEGTTLTASAGVFGSSVASEFGVSNDQSDSSSLDVQKSQNWNLSVTGPAADGINHDYDIFYLWLNPQFRVFFISETDLITELDVDGPTMNIQYVYAAWLRNPKTMPPGLLSIFEKLRFTQADFDEILATNPFQNASNPFDANRYLPTTQSFPYIPPFSANDKPPTITYTQKSTLTGSSTQASSTTTKMSYKITLGSEFAKIFSASLSNEKVFEWTNSSSTTSTKTSSQEATVVVAGPSFSYPGPTDVLVYWDAVFSSFAFRFPDFPPTYTGTLADATGVPLISEPVSLHVDGNELTTHTDHQGGFRFYNTTASQGEVAIRGNKTPVTLALSQAPVTHTI